MTQILPNMAPGRAAEAAHSSTRAGRYPLAGTVAGAISTLCFTAIHHILISDIWFSLLPMMVAGALCGLCVSWSYALLVERPATSSWLGYNLLYVAMLMLLGFASLLAFEPVTTVAALLAANGPPDELIGQALPLTAVFILISSAAISFLYGRDWRKFGAILLTTTVLVLLLGLNVSTLGLVSIPRGSLYLVAEMYGLILALNGVYVVAVILLVRRGWRHRNERC